MTAPTNLPAPTPALQEIANTAMTAGLPPGQVLVLARVLEAAIRAEPAGAPPAIELDLIAADTGLTHAEIGRHLAALIRTGWIAKDHAGHWRPAIAPHVHAGRPGARPAPEPA